jgi:hypothetical protein
MQGRFIWNTTLPIVMWRDKMDVPSQCTIVKTIDRLAYSSKEQGVVKGKDRDSA